MTHGFMAFMLASTVASGIVAPDLGQPVEEQLIMQHAAVGSRAATVYALRSPMAPAEAARQLTRQWRAEFQGPVIERERDGWHVVSRIAGGIVHTAQFRAAGGGSAGYRTEWSVMNAHQTASELDHLLTGLDIRQRLVTRDGSRRGETVFLVAARGLEAALELIRERLESAGYRADLLASRPRATPPLLVYRNANRDVVLSASERAGDTAVLIHFLTER